MTVSTAWLALVGAAVLVLLGDGAHGLMSRDETEDASDRPRPRDASTSHHRSREVSE